MTIRARENAGATEGDGSDSKTLVITLSTVLSVVFVATVVLTVYYCSRRGRRRRPGLGGLFRRGITPIGDDEIATWRLNRPEEEEKEEDKYTTRSRHTPNASTSTRKAPSVIQYPNGARGRPSEEGTITSPVASSIKRSTSFDLPRMPESAVLAVAPNARTGLTDETVPGDEPFLPSPTSPRRTTSSRLHKYPPSSPRNFQASYHRPRGSRSSSLKSVSSPHQSAVGGGFGGSSRPSAEMPARGESTHVHSSSTASHPPLKRPSYDEDDDGFTGLSPPPSRRTPSEEIGRALG